MNKCRETCDQLPQVGIQRDSKCGILFDIVQLFRTAHACLFSQIEQRFALGQGNSILHVLHNSIQYVNVSIQLKH